MGDRFVWLFFVHPRVNVLIDNNTLAKQRRQPGAFIGVDTVLKHLKGGPPRRRIGMIVDGAPARGKDIIIKLLFPQLFLQTNTQRVQKSIIRMGNSSVWVSF